MQRFKYPWMFCQADSIVSVPQLLSALDLFTGNGMIDFKYSRIDPGKFRERLYKFFDSNDFGSIYAASGTAAVPEGIEPAVVKRGVFIGIIQTFKFNYIEKNGFAFAVMAGIPEVYAVSCKPSAFVETCYLNLIKSGKFQKRGKCVRQIWKKEFYPGN